MSTERVRRAPLPLVLLWANYAAQADGMETWWLQEHAARRDAATVRCELTALREQADDIVTAWED